MSFVFSQNSRELPGTNLHQNPSASFSSNLLPPSSGTSSSRQDVKEEMPPPIPQRSNPSLMSPYTGLGGAYGSMYNNPYQSYMYGGAGGLYGYSNISNQMFPNNPMLNGLENASQNTFQSAQAFIGAFSSVSMMLESTLFAVQNSVRAVAGVADQFSHLKQHLVYTSESFIRILRHYFKKILALFRLSKPDQYEEQFWQKAVSGKRSSKEESKVYASLLFFTVLIAAPWFIWKLIRSLNTEESQEEKWFQGSGEHFVAEVKFPFTARNNDELSLSANTFVRLAPKHRQPNIRGWLLAATEYKQGLIPANYIKIMGKNRSVEKIQNVSEIEESVEKPSLESIFESEVKSDDQTSG